MRTGCHRCRRCKFLRSHTGPRGKRLQHQPVSMLLPWFRNIRRYRQAHTHKQECIPVGCVPSAAVTAGGGVVCRGGVSAQGVSARGWVSARGCLPGGISQHALRQTPSSPADRMTDRCKNITLPQLHCGRLKPQSRESYKQAAGSSC